MDDIGDQPVQMSATPTVDKIHSEILPTTSLEDAPIATSGSPRKDVEIKSSKTSNPIKKLDGFVSHLNRLMHTRDSHDAVILFLACASHFLATALETPVSERLQHWTTILSRLVLKNAPTRLSTSIPFSKLASHITTIRIYRQFLAERARAVSGILDDWQIITRLWGLLGIWAEAKEYLVSLTETRDADQERNDNPRDYFVSKVIKATYIFGLLGYLSFENLAWLTRRGVFKKSEKTESKLMILSLKGWGVYVFAELAQLFHDRSLTNRGLRVENEGSTIQWRKRLVQMLIYAPVTVHWIKDGGLFPEVVASFLVAYAEYITVQGLWRESA
ncbi:hypothetical protein FSPOR_3712 [Fusarium sporotrichioides]|uniref:Peroxin 11c n=1 Tax=Fusarium sporotrichioides TaxID=5514 RepID=A0A395SF20_FUSSP|nr:hypothetical protein FSPOR_3712 [Fusarium sporotrichioides]